MKPMTADAVEALRNAGPLDEIVLLPLYPHFSYATTLSSLKEWKRVYAKLEGAPPERTVGQFYNHPLYIQALDDPELAETTRQIFLQAPQPREQAIIPHGNFASFGDDEKRNYENRVVSFFLLRLPAVAKLTR